MPKLAEAIRRVLPNAEAYVFGSVVEDRFTALSDIDVLIVLDEVPRTGLERAEIKARIREELEKLGIEFSYIFELHLVDRNEAKRYLSRSKYIRIV